MDMEAELETIRIRYTEKIQYYESALAKLEKRRQKEGSQVPKEKAPVVNTLQKGTTAIKSNL